MTPTLPVGETVRARRHVEYACVTEGPTRWSLGRLIPLTLALWAIADVLPRFLPLDWLQINPFQLAASRPGRYSPFIPNLRISTSNYVGELALLANLPPNESRPPLQLTTDNLGFRATPNGSTNEKPSIIVMEGDSFTFGAALSNDETFPSALSRELAANVYNAGRYTTDRERMREMDWLFSRLPVAPRATVIYVLLETFNPSLKREYGDRWYDSLGKKVVGSQLHNAAKEEYFFLRRWHSLWLPISPLKISTTRLYKRIADDRILPNPYKKHVTIAELPGGRRFLYEPRYLERYLNPPDDTAVAETAEYLAWFRDQMRSRGLDFWVLLVPEGLSTYARWLVPDSEHPVKWKSHYLDRLENALQARQVKVTNSLPHLVEQAPEDIRTGELSFYTEDHHWTPKGTRTVARVMADALRQSGFQETR